MPNARKGKKGNRRTKERGNTIDALTTSLIRVGLRVIEISPDGNCLFRAFASQYCSDEGMA